MEIKEKKLSDICEIIAGQSPKSDTYNKEGVGLPFFQGKADFGVTYPRIVTYCSEPIRIAEKNDVLLSVRAPVGACNLSPGKVCIGRGLSAIRPKDENELSYMYLFYFFRFYECTLKTKGTGTTFASITQAVIKNITIQYPCIEEQNRVVSRIEELSSELDAGIEELNKAKEKLLRYRLAVINESLGKVKKHIPLREIIEKPKYGTSQKCTYQKEPNMIGVFRIPNVLNGRLSNDDMKYTFLSDEEKKKVGLRKNDILIIRSNGSLSIVGKTAIVKERDCCNVFAGYLIRIRFLNPSDILAKYVQFAFESHKGRCYIRERAKSTSGVNNINAKEIEQMMIPICSEHQMEKIVEEIEERLPHCEKINEIVEESLNRAYMMRQSILKQAFEGRI